MESSSFKPAEQIACPGRGTARAPRPSMLLALPLELRQNIYEYCIPQGQKFNCSFNLYNLPESVVPYAWGGREQEAGWRFARYDCPHWNEFIFDIEKTKGMHYDQFERNVHNSWQCRKCRSNPTPGSLICVCRQIHDEVEPMLYGRNTFFLNLDNDDAETDLPLFSIRAQTYMRDVVLVMGPHVFTRDTSIEFRMDPEIWGSLFSEVTRLTLIIEAPKFRAANMGSDVTPARWHGWMAPILQYLDHVLPSMASIVVDANASEHAMAIFKKMLPGRCRFQRLRVADPIFERGDFADEAYSGWFSDVDDDDDDDDDDDHIV